jgi:NADH:ubiquinone oxidoreductase subunit K
MFVAEIPANILFRRVSASLFLGTIGLCALFPSLSIIIVFMSIEIMGRNYDLYGIRQNMAATGSSPRPDGYP